MIDLPIIDASEANENQPKQRFWRSVPHLRKDPSFQEQAQHEFLPGATDAPSGATRRQFMQLMGASIAMAGLSACRRPIEQVMPYTRQPEEIIPGIPMYYATAMPFRGSVRPIVVESHEGRPTKVEGNPEHPGSRGATSVFEQASVLTLYDPDRSRVIRRQSADASWQDFVDFCRDLPAGSRIVVMSEETSSPTVQALRQQVQQRFAQLRWMTYCDAGDDPAQLGMQLAFGRPLRPQYDFSQAAVIVSLDADFLSPTERNFLQQSHSFADSRRLNSADDPMSRLYVIESAYSNTGALADNRLRLRAGDIPAFASALAARLGVGGAASGPFANHPYVAAIADDLRAAGSQSVILAGDSQPPEVHALCAAINSTLGSIGTTMTLLDTGAEPMRPQHEDLAELVLDMEAGNVDVLITLGVNPVYSAPASLNFAGAMQRVNETVHMGLWMDETAQAARWHLPRTHYLEAWGDGRSYDGTLSVIQPLIAPLYDATHSDIEILHALATGLNQPGYDLVRQQWQGVIPGSFDEGWRRVLHDGFLPNTGYATTGGTAQMPSLTLPTVSADDIEVVFRIDPTVLDGFYANNAWCMELPDPMTKIVWDNVATMSPATATQLGLEAEYSEGQYHVDLVTLDVAGHQVELPVWIMPGHADGSISVTLGYGRQIASNREHRTTGFWDLDDKTDIYAGGPLANGIGQNVAPLRPTASTNVVVGVQAEKTGSGYMIVTTQDHGAIDPEARPVVRLATYDEYREDPAFVEAFEAPTPGEPFDEYPALWGDRDPHDEPAQRDSPYYRNQWGMVIDMNTCIGCNTCVVACQSENNIQVVGKSHVAQGREMHWLRIDRYYVTGHTVGEHTDHEEMTEDEIPANPLVMFQPMPCQHCENAPCESVCPVAATSHSSDGINEMTYNRCIGTRYCSNNCPYKVRRYNFFNWSKTIPLQVQMAQNPDVTVRFRGVMEKCTFCVQRVRQAQRRVQQEERTIQDGEVQTACQQACPAQAITFGDLSDPASMVSRQKLNPRNYAALAELDVKPRVSYLGRVLNPNPVLAATRDA